MEFLQILLIEEDAQEYLHVRQFLEGKVDKHHIDWAPNYENALKMARLNTYHVYLVGCYVHHRKQETFLRWLYDYATVPIILLVKLEVDIEELLIDRYKTDYILKDQLNWEVLQRSMRYVSKLMDFQQVEKKYRMAFNHSFEFISLLNPDGVIDEANQTTLNFISNRKSLVGKFFLDSAWVTPANQTPFKNALSQAMRGNFARLEIDVPWQNQETLCLDFSFKPVKDSQGKILWIIAEARDLTDRKRIEQEFNHVALHDQLTGLPNRHLFMEHLEAAVAKSRKDQNYHLAVLYMDLDRFKMINDSLGHEMGDWLLMEISQRLHDCLGEGDILARAGGDEFVILLDNMKNHNEATLLAIKINEELARPFNVDHYKVAAAASIGITYNTRSKDAADLLREADTAMYHAKMMGKSHHTTFCQEMYTAALSRLQIETELHTGMAQNKFILFYQPQTELVSDELVGVESLIRFQHPTNGLIFPRDFIPILEDSGIIIKLGEWILQTACQQLRTWLDQGLTIATVSVNVSAHQFRSKYLINMVAEALAMAKLEPHQLELELTENLLLEDTPLAVKTLHQFKDMGIRVTIDDFGMGYASLSYLKRFPVDGLKIDKSFIKGINTSVPEDIAIIVATIDMAHALGLKVIAEGVETVEQRDFLRDHGCDYAQGYLYAPAMQQSDLSSWARQYRRVTHNRLGALSL